jgi:thioredoxin-related protein
LDNRIGAIARMRIPLLRLLFLVLGLAALALPAAPPAAGAELVMFEAAGCPYCARWNREIAPIYPKTEEGKRAPLRRVDTAQPRPADLAAIVNIVYTPTFVLMDEGREIGRIVGYGGDEIFWSLLAELMAKLGRPREPRRAALPAAAE